MHTKREVPVTLGFQQNICNSCRGIPEESHPKSPRAGRTSKIGRYYWREIAFETTKRFADWAEKQGYPDQISGLIANKDQYRSIEREVIEDIKKVHQESPKYKYQDESQIEVITKNKVEVVSLKGIYGRKPERGVAILHEGTFYSAEDFVAHHFDKLGYNAILTESTPFHVLFGVFMWMLIQDPADPNVRLAGFGNRRSSEKGNYRDQIWTFLPSDFGSRGYANRRVSAIEKHVAAFPSEKEELLWLFDYWTEPSEDLRQYLWAYRSEDIATARKVVTVLPVDVLVRILRYLVGEYWHRFCGWPDILFFNEDGFFFAEVKSSNDELSEDQKSWIRGNTTELRLPFKLVKIHKKGTIDSPRTRAISS